MLAVTRSKSRAWLTTDNTPGDIICYRAFLPENYLHCFIGALELLTSSENWEQIGTDTPDEVAGAFLDAYLMTLKGGNCTMQPGLVMPFAGGSAPDGFLLCDGSQYNITDYQALFAAIGYAWGGSGPVFNVPDLVDRVPVGSGGDFSFTGTGGEKTHTLTEPEMPNHFHLIANTTFLPVQAGAGTFVLGLLPPSNHAVQSAGGGGSHNNMQPYVAMNYVIKT